MVLNPALEFSITDNTDLVLTSHNIGLNPIIPARISVVWTIG